MKSLGVYISYILRHDPDAIGISMNNEGWVSINDLISKSLGKRKKFNHDDLMETVKTDDKQRFQISEDGKNIRAVQGHSTQYVNRKFNKVEPPITLYHGTATQYLDSIMKNGLIPKNRHYVHLSSNLDTANKVGERHGTVVILEVNAKEMHDQGHEFYYSENKVWLTKEVPVKYIKKLPTYKNKPRKP